MTDQNILGLTVTVEDYSDQSLQLSFDPQLKPEVRESSDGSLEIVLTFEHLTYALASAIEALENYEEDDDEDA